KAKVVVVPLRVGGGTRLKILEAMAMGKAIVSTSIGAEGLNVNNRRDIILADSPNEFISSLTTLLNDKEYRDAMGHQARNNVISNYDWKIIGKALNAVYS